MAIAGIEFKTYLDPEIGPKEKAKRLFTLGATMANGRLPEADGTHTFRVFSGANRGLLFSTRNPEQNFASGQYEPEVTNMIADLSVQGATVYDVGGNIGWDTLVAARRVGPAGRVYTFEPSEGNLPLLRRNITENKFGSSVTVVEKAVGARTETLTFARYAGCELVNHLVTPETQAHSDAILYQMPVISLDDFVAKGNKPPSLIKIDIEGHELPALKGAEGTLSAFKPAVICEVRRETWDDIEKQMTKLGYSIRMLGGRGRGLKGPGVDDALFTHPKA